MAELYEINGKGRKGRGPALRVMWFDQPPCLLINMEYNSGSSYRNRFDLADWDRLVAWVNWQRHEHPPADK